MLTIKVCWGIEDGYAGKNRPQHLTVSMHEDEWNEMSEEERQDYLDDEVREDFENKVSFYFNIESITTE